jgi:hypothetical protein
MSTLAPIPCPDCRYDLRGLATPDGARCPECGGTFTSRDIRLAGKRWMRRCILLVIACVPVMSVVMIMLTTFLPWNLMIGSLAPIWGSYPAGVAWCLVFERRAALLYTSPEAPLWARGLTFLCSLLLCAVVAAVLFPGAFFIAAAVMSF